MKKITMLSFFILFGLNMYSQTVNNNHIKDEEFRQFVKKFPTMDIPINEKRESSPSISKDKNILRKEAIKFLKRTDESMYYLFCHYNYDTDACKYEKLECVPGVRFKLLTNNYIVLTVGEGKLKSDTALTTLHTFDYNGNIIDKCIVGKHFTREDDFVGFIMQDERHFQVYWYSTNFDNYNIHGSTFSVKDENGPMSKVYIEEYEILNNGKIKKIKTSDIIYLKGTMVDYRFRYNNRGYLDDDPMLNI
jgi:hypothetical protein